MDASSTLVELRCVRTRSELLGQTSKCTNQIPAIGEFVDIAPPIAGAPLGTAVRRRGIRWRWWSNTQSLSRTPGESVELCGRIRQRCLALGRGTAFEDGRILRECRCEPRQSRSQIGRCHEEMPARAQYARESSKDLRDGLLREV